MLFFFYAAGGEIYQGHVNLPLAYASRTLEIYPCKDRTWAWWILHPTSAYSIFRTSRAFFLSICKIPLVFIVGTLYQGGECTERSKVYEI